MPCVLWWGYGGDMGWKKGRLKKRSARKTFIVDRVKHGIDREVDSKIRGGGAVNVKYAERCHRKKGGLLTTRPDF